MANCPHCGHSLKPWEIKAECPKCGTNMVNYQWEERLEQDAINAEKAFQKFHVTLAKLKYAFTGTKLRIARIPVSVLPLFSFLLPLANVSIMLPFYEKTQSMNIISIVTTLLDANLGALPAFLQSDITGDAALLLLLSLAGLVVSALSLIVTLVFFIFNFLRFKSPGMFVCNLFGAGGMIMSVVCFNNFSSMLGASTLSMLSTSISFGAIVGAVLFLIAACFNLKVALTPITEDFEKQARLKEEAEKEEAEREINERRAKVEADRERLEAEQAELVRQAKERQERAAKKEEEKREKKLAKKNGKK